tara:strand:+ start:1224 stop:3932 length:2709 start_codon:yes stop_codon:yes gene_type:complete
MLIFKEKQFQTFNNLEKYISELELTTDKGQVFEEFNRLFFEYYKDNYNLKNIWFDCSPHHKIPSSIKRKLCISSNDKGADGVVETNCGKYYVVQTKFRSNRASATYSEFTNTSFQARKCDGMYIFANSYAIPNEFRNEPNVFPILVNELIDSSTAEFFNWAYESANNKAQQPILKKHIPLTYQQRAIDSIVEGFKKYNRGQYIAACGSGKTLTSLWVKEKLDCKKTLFLVPSIYLIKQTLKEWNAQKSDSYSFCCICSDNDINKLNNDEFDSSEDIVDINLQELGVRATTDSNELVKFFIENHEKKIVIFSTYQSSDVVSEAINKLEECFDLIICDEAHKTAGVEKRLFGKVLKDENIKSSKRLFLTATPKVLSRRAMRIADQEQFEYFDMNDESIYGKVFDTFSFAEAIDEKAITDYEILIMGVDESEADIFKDLNGITDLNGRDVQNKDIAITVAVERLMKDDSYNVKKVINFSNSIKRSDDFISNIKIPGIDKDVFGVAASISSKKTSSQRNEIMQEFINSERAILSNARCLTEGVDVPGVDAVVFSDKKESPIDIVQAVGRALRINKNNPEKIAKIFIPIVINEENSSIDIDKYRHVFEIIESLRMHDQSLSAEIDNLHGALVGISSGNGKKKIRIQKYNNTNLEKLKNSLIPQIAKLNGEVFKNLKIKYSGQKTKTPKTNFKIVGRYNFTENNFGTLFSNNILSSLSKDTFTKPEVSDNNFPSHAYRLGLIEKMKGGMFKITELGERFVNGEPLPLIAAEYFETKDSLEWHPYQMIHKILKSSDNIDVFGWLYGLNIINKNDEAGIQKSTDRIKKINSLNLDFNLIKLNYSNCMRIIHFLNNEFKEDLEVFNFKYDPEMHLYRSGLLANVDYLGNHLSCCWPDKYSYDRKHKRISIK